MADTPDRFLARMYDWNRRAERYRALSELLGEDEETGRLAGLAQELENQLRDFEALAFAARNLAARTEVLLAELDTILIHARAAQGTVRVGPRYSADDVREEARLCVEEAEAAVDHAKRRAIAARAFDLAQLAEEIGRIG